MKVSDLVRALETIAPLDRAESWDNVGLLVGDRSAPVDSVLLTIDATRAVLEEAARERCSFIVAYHPPIFEGLKRFVDGHVAFEAARRGIAIYSPHTALDVAEGGTNDVLADALGMTERAPLRESGIGRIGSVAGTVSDLLGRLKKSLSLEAALVSGPIDRRVTRAAVCAGAGGDLLKDAIAARVQLFVTGELRHHDALRADAAGVATIALRHSASERCALPALAKRITAAAPDVRVVQSREDRDPFAFA